MEVKRHIYVEFVGPHTAGKTTVLKKIIDDRLLTPLLVVEPYQMLRKRWHFLVSVPFLSLRTFRHLFFVTRFCFRFSEWQQWTNWSQTWQYLIKMVILHPYYERYVFDVWLKDDMLHILPHLIFKSGVEPKEAFNTFFNHFSYLYSGIIYMDITELEMLKRLKLRNKNKSSKFHASWESVYRRTYAQSRAMKEMLAEQERIPVLMLSGDEGLGHNARKAAEFIRNLALGDRTDSVL